MLASMSSTLFIAFVNHHCVHKSSHNKVYQLTFPAALCLSSLQGSIACRYKQHSSTKLKQNGKLHHSQKGALSVSLSGAEFAITFGKAITLDSSHQESPGCAVIAPAHMLYLLECACVIYRCCCCSGLQSSQSAIVVAAAVTAACGTFTAQPPLISCTLAGQCWISCTLAGQCCSSRQAVQDTSSLTLSHMHKMGHAITTQSLQLSDSACVTCAV